jgi:(1->4)-alpha-D-glucan 1-alpha-D-glucosylmutase
MKPLRVPLATYRIQLNREFTFVQATGLVPYLARLGVSHVYCSPYLKARAGSPHGYDIVDHGSLNPEIGTREDYERFVAALEEHGMGQMLDIVPNHMGVGGDDNPWWLDVLENGQASDYAAFFDIDWLPAKPELRGKVLLPLLEDHYGSAIERGLLRLEFDAARGELSARYYGHRFPLDPKTYPQVLGERLEQLDAEEPQASAYRGLVTGFGGLPSRHETTPERRALRGREKEELKQRLAELCRLAPGVGAFVEESVRRCNDAADPAARFQRLHALLEEQPYRLAYWRVAADEINYRRFFDVNTLAALRMERPEVFAATHRLVLDLVAEGSIHALRIDHPDGLYDPARYLRALREAIAARAAGGEHLYVVAEKILMPGESLPEDWVVDGTTGYDFAALANGLFVHGDGEEPLTALFERVAGPVVSFADLVFERKKLVMRALMSGELMVLANLLDGISEGDPHTRDYTLHALRDALMDVIACFPVYRTYATAAGMSAQDRAWMVRAIAQARRRSPAADVSVFNFIATVLLLEGLEQRPAAQRAAILDFVLKFQQYTAPVMAKGLEDTTFYVYNRLVSLNDVGGDPHRFGTKLEDFHAATAQRRARWPQALLTTSTHDSKRSEDMRARLNVLSEIPNGWRDRVLRWSRLNREYKRMLDGEPAPDGNDEYLLYQTLLGAWPLEPLDDARRAQFRARIEAYMLKAVREAKRYTSWINPNAEYEAALAEFVRALLPDSGGSRFLADFLPFQRDIARFGLLNALSQTLLKLTVPGVPDFYQGNEIWDFSLVDPDNRRAVDYAQRRALLEQLQTLAPFHGQDYAARVRLLVENLADGRAKLHLLCRLLELRRRLPELWQHGDYVPLTVSGVCAPHVCAFLRRHGENAIVAVAARWFTRLPQAGKAAPLGEAVWNDTWIWLPPEEPRLTGEEVLAGQPIQGARRGERSGFPVARLLSHFPGAVVWLR